MNEGIDKWKWALRWLRIYEKIILTCVKVKTNTLRVEINNCSSILIDRLYYILNQISTSALPIPVLVTRMLIALTMKVLSAALVNKDLLEMESLAKVLMNMFVCYHLSCLFMARRCNFCLRYRRVFQEWQPLWRECGLFEQRRVVHLHLQRWIYRKRKSLWW